MITIINLLTIIITTTITLKCIYKLINNHYSLLHICLIVYYIMQCLPLIFELFYDLNTIKQNLNLIFYKAMTDEYVALIYDFYVIVTSYILYVYANKYANNKNQFSLSLKIQNHMIRGLIAVMMFVPIVVALIMAPNPNIYTIYGYFYVVDPNQSSIDYLYYSVVMHWALTISAIFILIRYFTKYKKSNWDVYLSLLLITWLSQKRTLTIFIMIGILGIDFIKNNYSDKKLLVRKAIVFCSLIAAYFIIYNNNVKYTGDDFFTTYTAYFSRLNVEKVAIYDILYDNKLLEYRGQSVLYNLCWFVPRSIWPDKPAMYCKYFTAYSEYGVGNENYWLPFNYQVNIWGDWVSSFGLLGHFFALIFVILVIHYSEQSNSMALKCFGLFFIILYLMFGFEHIVAYLFTAFMALVIKSKIKLLKLT